MKKIFLSLILLFFAGVMLAQDYPTPEYNNEICLYKKDSNKLVRLEKGSSKLETKAKVMGIGGMENGYTLDGEKSTVRLSNGDNLTFIISSGSASNLTPEADSAMKAGGMDLSGAQGGSMAMNDPSHNTTLYSMSSDKGKRKILLGSASGISMFGKTKKLSTKYTLSVKKVKDNYYLISVDKNLPKGEYAFVTMSLMDMDASGAYLLFAFAVD